MRKVIVLSVIGALILCFGTGMAAEKKFLKMVSGPEGGSWYPLGSRRICRGFRHPMVPEVG
jgi:TRAP-type uncharacterized transport system substrate-binding protein